MIIEAINKSQRIVLKIGTNVITKEDGRLNLTRLSSLVTQIVELKKTGKDILVITSGAIGAGMAKLNLKEKPTDLVMKQVAAAVGQSSLMYHYEEYFKMQLQQVAQILLNQDDLLDETKKANLANTLSALLKLGVIPVINENDVTSTKEIAPTEESKEWLNFSDNDTLSAAIACELKADLMIILTDVDGIFDSYPPTKNSMLIEHVSYGDRNLEIMANGKSSKGRGGMLSKIKAAGNAAERGVETIIANGHKNDIVRDLLCGRAVCTFFNARR